MCWRLQWPQQTNTSDSSLHSPLLITVFIQLGPVLSILASATGIQTVPIKKHDDGKALGNALYGFLACNLSGQHRVNKS